MPLKQAQLVTALRSDKGLLRGNNEDAVAEDIDIGLLALADGMGGYNAGEVASAIAINSMLETVRGRWQRLDKKRTDPVSGHGSVAQLLREAFLSANTAILQAALRNPAQNGMGTTAVAALIHDDRLAVAYVGDSRLYRLRAGQLQAVTRDHSLVEELVARGHYSRDEATQRVRRNIVTRALGVEPAVEVDLIEARVEPGDLILLCSDGLTDMVDDETIRLILSEHGADLDTAAEQLVSTANAHGGHDNITVALARVDGASAEPRSWWRRLRDGRRSRPDQPAR